MSDESSMKAYLAENPRMVGVLFTMMLLLSQSMSAAAAHGSGLKGP